MIVLRYIRLSVFIMIVSVFFIGCDSSNDSSYNEPIKTDTNTTAEEDDTNTTIEQDDTNTTIEQDDTNTTIEQDDTNTTGAPDDTNTTGAPADTNTTGAPADTNTTGAPADTDPTINQTYEQWKNDNNGTELEFLSSLIDLSGILEVYGVNSIDINSTDENTTYYDQWLANGNIGSEIDYLNSINITSPLKIEELNSTDDNCTSGGLKFSTNYNTYNICNDTPYDEYLDENNDTLTISIYENKLAVFRMNLLNSVATYSLEEKDEDGNILDTNESSFDINSTNGVVSFKSSPDYEQKNSYFIKAIAIVSGDLNITRDINITILDEVDEKLVYTPIYDPDACITKGYNMLEDNSFDAEDKFDTNSSIAIKSLYPITYSADDGLIKLYYKDNGKTVTRDNSYRDNSFLSPYAILYGDNWFSESNNTVYIQKPTDDINNSCFRAVLDSDSIDEPIKVSLSVSKKFETNTIGKLATGQMTSYLSGDDGDNLAGIKRRYTKEDNIVIDHISNLMWDDSGTTKDVTYTQLDANTACGDLSEGNYTDWRLPSIKESLSIIHREKSSPVVDEIFTNIKGTIYWTSTKYHSNDDYYWYVNFDNGEASRNTTNIKYNVKCVRDRY